ncbi:SGNH/GDSL hydrolase family protein [Bradyrhizobium valentinum]|uniref:SGNH hydrolase-type esterase domain-containing protein n=1 Tax=Bradyrhizobium valentinum TaxID=1518501 RepID=A0A0R3L034_9BRAD|nr:SGNH/GDSL hydrolase family protein [Bradyrhizobium valentinum]KRQ99260.1 hypothetical protein CP49_11725 [Bradyrhizobium valentinum]
MGISLALGLGVTDVRPPIAGAGPAPVLLPLHSRIVFEGDSITIGSNGPTYAGFALIRSLGRFFAPSGYNQGTGGQTAAQMATQVATIAALNPKVVVLLAGTNDLSGTSDTPATIFANLRTCIDAYKAAGAQVVNICVLPRNDATWMGLSAGRRADREALNALIRAQNDVAVVDLEATFDPTTMCGDGLHPHYRGAIHVGNAVGDALNTLIASQSVLSIYDTAENFLVGANENPLFAGAAGTKTGTPAPTGDVPTNWIVEHNDSGFAVVSSITTLNGRPAVRLQVSGNNTTNGRIVNLRNVVTYAGAAGEFWEMWWDFSLAAGAQNLRAIWASTDTAAMPNNTATVLYPSDVAVAGVLRPPMTTALAGSDVSVTMQGAMTFAAGPVAADITWAAPCYRKVPVGQ